MEIFFLFYLFFIVLPILLYFASDEPEIKAKYIKNHSIVHAVISVLMIVILLVVRSDKCAWSGHMYCFEDDFLAAVVLALQVPIYFVTGILWLFIPRKKKSYDYDEDK